MIQYAQVNKCNTSHKRKEKDHMIIFINADKAFEKVRHPFMIKNTQQSGTRESIAQHNKGYIRENYSQHHIQWAKTKIFSTKIRIRLQCYHFYSTQCRKF